MKKGDYVARIMYGKVESVSKSSARILDLDMNDSIVVQGEDLIESFISAGEYTETQVSTRTEMAELLINSWGMPFTVSFEKLDGSYRVLIGYLIKPETLLGRSMVRDLEMPDGDNVRLVDHRTIDTLIINGVKHVLK